MNSRTMGSTSRPPAEPTPDSPPRVGWRALGFALLLFLVWTLTFTFLVPPDLLRVQVGEPAPRNIKAPRRLVYISDVRTEEARNAAVARVADVYTSPDMNIALNQLQALEETLSEVTAIRALAEATVDATANREQQLALLADLDELRVHESVLPKILDISPERWPAVSAEAVRVLDLLMRDEIREGQAPAKAQQAYLLMGREFSPAERDVISALMGSFVQANSFLDAARTAANREAARRSVEPIQGIIRAGESIVREGEIVSPLALEKLQALGLLEEQIDWLDAAGSAAFALCLVAMLVTYVARCQPTVLDRPRRQLLLLLTLAAVAVGARLAIPGHILAPYLFPAAAAGMLVAAMLNVEIGVVVAGVTAILVGADSGGVLQLFVYAMVGGVVGAVSIARVDQLGGFLRSAAFVALANMAVILAFQLRSPVYDTRGLLELLASGLGNGILSGSLAFLAFAVIGRAFGITTFMQLLELARPTHPLFRQLLIKAPGTYHHSIIVSNMAERAAQAIGADPLLARVGSYYHDIGKITRPYFFAENQADADNPHDRLDPKTSAEIIIAHTLDGLALARRYGLPERVCDFIPEHHGRAFASYFYHRASQQNGGEPVPEEHYRYPGPRPQTRETAIVMLADSIEAAVRAKRPATQAETRTLVHKIILDRLTQGELDECPLTMHDLERTRNAFLSVLQGVFHPRIDYPERVTSTSSTDPQAEGVSR